MRLVLAPLVVGVAISVLGPGAASAATCADHPNQASAQRAQDTRDADGDGVYCEALPCPCLGAGAGDNGSAGAPATRGPRPKPAAKRRAQRFEARITSVVDGDTIRVRAFAAKRDFYTVRLIGIDTPETKRPGVGVECGGKRATSHMLALAFTAPTDADGDGLFDSEGGIGRRVALVTDPTQDTFDGYDRLLAYVTPRGKPMLQPAMLSAGWAETYVYGGKPFQKVERFRAGERKAKTAGRGVWSLCGGDFHRSV